MSSSWPNFISNCKSRLSAIARSCYLGRELWSEKFAEAEQSIAELREELAKYDASQRQLEQENLRLRARIEELEAQAAQPRALELPLGEAPQGQQYGAGLISLCVNLARRVGLRRTVGAMEIFFNWLGVQVAVPVYQSIRGWMQRIGLDRLQRVKKSEGDILIVDHTNQIGQEKVLTILRVPSSRLADSDVPLRHEDVEVVALVPGKEWKRDNVAKVYQDVVKRCGHPRGIVSDGAVELREPVETLGKPGERPLALRDPKHFLANQLEALLKKDPQYQSFTDHIGGARSALHQTELAHFIPPGFKMKARFMNLAPTVNWASTVLWHLDNPQSQSRRGITEDRMNAKLGWLRNFAPNIRQWQQCLKVVSTALELINSRGIFKGVVKQLKKLVARLTHCRMSRKLVNKTVKLLSEYERQLRPNERLPMSTEIEESSFSLYKQFEQQHSKGGFTSLLLTYPTLLRETTATEVHASFVRVRIADVKDWVKKNLSTTLAPKRQLIFKEAKSKIPKTPKRATPLSAAA